MTRKLLYVLVGGGVLAISITYVTLNGYVGLGGQKEEIEIDLKEGRTLTIGQDENGGITVEQQAGKVPEPKDIGSTVKDVEKEAAAKEGTGGLVKKVADETIPKSAGDPKKAEAKAAKYPLPKGAELIYEGERIPGINLWKKDTNPKDVPTYLTTYSNGKKTFCLGFCGSEPGKTLYRVHIFVGGDNSLTEAGIIKVPKGGKEDRDMVNAFYHLLELCKEKRIEGRQVVYVLGKEPYAYVLPEVRPISLPK